MLRVCIVLLSMLLPVMGYAKTHNIPIANAEVVGSDRLSVLFWDVYDATLYAPNGKWSEHIPYALKLKYLMDFTGQEIAERSIEEIQKQGYTNDNTLAVWNEQMQNIFPDVSEGEAITGVYRPGHSTEFYQGTTKIGVIEDPEFGTWFFNIWLGKNTSEPELRKSLLGLQ